MKKLVRLTKKNGEKYFEFWHSLYQNTNINPYWFKPINLSANEFKNIYNNYLENPNIHFFIYLNEQDEPTSTARLTCFSGARSHAVTVNALATDPKQQGKGYISANRLVLV